MLLIIEGRAVLSPTKLVVGVWKAHCLNPRRKRGRDLRREALLLQKLPKLLAASRLYRLILQTSVLVKGATRFHVVGELIPPTAKTPRGHIRGS